MFCTLVTWGSPKSSAVMGPTCPVAPSLLSFPKRIRSNPPRWFRAPARTRAVTTVSLPAAARSVIRTPWSAPVASAVRRAASKSDGPMVSAVTDPPAVSRRSQAHWSAFRSAGLTCPSVPSRTRLLVTGSTETCSDTGTCLTQTARRITAYPTAGETPTLPAGGCFRRA